MTPSSELAPISVEAELVTTPDGRPKVGRHSKYRPEYCEILLQFYSDMLEQSGRKLIESEFEEVRSKRTEDTDTTRDDAGRPRESDGKFVKKPTEAIEGQDPPPERKISRGERRTIRKREFRWVVAELPSLEKFARSIGVSTRVINNWKHLYPSFEEAVEQALDMGRDAIVQRGLAGQYDPQMVIFICKNWYQMKDRHEITGADGAPLNPPAQLREVPMHVIDETLAVLQQARQRLIENSPTAGQQQGESAL